METKEKKVFRFDSFRFWLNKLKIKVNIKYKGKNKVLCQTAKENQLAAYLKKNQCRLGFDKVYMVYFKGDSLASSILHIWIVTRLNSFKN